MAAALFESVETDVSRALGMVSAMCQRFIEDSEKAIGFVNCTKSILDKLGRNLAMFLLWTAR